MGDLLRYGIQLAQFSYTTISWDALSRGYSDQWTWLIDSVPDIIELWVISSSFEVRFTDDSGNFVCIASTVCNLFCFIRVITSSSVERQWVTTFLKLITKSIELVLFLRFHVARVE